MVHDLKKKAITITDRMEGTWESNVHTNVMLLVKELIEFTESYKFLRGKDKKLLAMLLLKEIFRKELVLSDLDESKKSVIMAGINHVIDPALEIALYAAKGNIKLNKKTLWNVCFLFCKL